MLAERIRVVKPSATLEITAKAKKLKAQGKDIIGFGGGEPDFDTPVHIKEAAERAIQEGFVYYTPTNGIPELREAIAQKLKEENSIECEGEKNIIVTPGAKQALYEAIMVMVNSGEEVLIPSPYWVSYLPMVQLAQGKARFIKTPRENDFKLTAEQLERSLNPKTKLLILNTPSNPTGSVLNEKELRAIARVCSEHGLYVISDEIYEYMLYGEEHVSLASFPGMEDLTITVNGFSKSYSMTGWRLGYACANQDIVKAMQRLQAHSVSHPTSFVQMAGVEALNNPRSREEISRMVGAFGERRKLMLQKLRDIPEVDAPEPRGAFYIFADFSSYEEDSFKLSNYLLEEANVTGVPGEAFGESYRGYIRLSYALGKEKIEEGMERIKLAMDKY